MSAAMVRATVIEKAEPIEILREAMNWAALRNLSVAPGGYGVRVVRVFGLQRWLPIHDSRFVDPLGAAVLMVQPLAGMLPEAAAEALGVSVPVVEGFRVGFERQAPPASWARAHARASYMLGLELGARMRLEVLTEKCPKHGNRFRHSEVCPSCEIEEQAAADARSLPGDLS